MYKKFLAGLIVLAFSWTLSADELQLQPNHPDSYVVVKGDTLWDISGRFLTKPWLWPEIWEVNPQIENPHLIYPGDLISLHYQDGKPVLRLQRGGMAQGRNVKLSPSVRVSEHDNAIQPIPLDAIRQFLTKPRIVSKEELEMAPYIVSSYDEHLINGSGAKVYVREVQEGAPTRYGVYRSGGPYKNLGSEEVLGYEAIYVGDAQLQRYGDPATLILTDVEKETLTGDRLLPQEDYADPQFIPHPPVREVNGSIISVLDGVSQIGQHKVVVLNLGDSDGIEVGHVMGIFQAGKVIRDTVSSKEVPAEKFRTERYGENPLDNVVSDLVSTVQGVARHMGPHQGRGVEVQLPEERIGNLMVFRTFERVSYALVMDLTRPAHLYDSVSNP